MQTPKSTSVYALALCAAVLAGSNSTQAGIESNFDDGVYPGGPGDGWVDGWQNTVGAPIFRTNEPLPSLTGTTPYIHLNAAGNAYRNFMRQMQNGAGVNLAIPHYIRWKFRLAETNFAAGFTASGDRVHFFGRNGARLGGSSDASVNWMIYCSGAAGVVGGDKMFWLCDNWNGSGAFDVNTAVNTGVPLVPFHIYAFEVYVVPDQQTFTLSIVDESTNNASFTSSAPHKFRNLSAAPTSFTYLHFGAQASTAASEVRPFDLDSVSITPWAGPIVENLVPNNGAVHWASNAVLFTVHADAGIDPSGISVLLNSNDITSQLVITGDPTNRSVSFTGLTPNLKYKMELTTSNSAGQSALTSFFYTPESSPVTLFDAGGFSDDLLYPLGYLTTVTNNDCFWVPSAAPNSGEIIDLDDGQYEKVLRRQQLGGSYHDYLLFPPVSSGVVEIELDARVPAMTGRVIDLSLNSVTSAGGGVQGPFIMWATNALYYFDVVLDSWVLQTNLDSGWHHFKLICYASGALGNTFDLEVDNAPVGQGLPWRTPSITVGTLRVGTLNTGAVPGEYGEVDNLVIRVAPEPLAALPVTLLNPVHTGSAFSFSFASLAGINYLVQTNATLTSANWGTMATIGGDGTIQTVTHSNPPAGGLFYRVESQLP